MLSAGIGHAINRSTDLQGLALQADDFFFGDDGKRGNGWGGRWDGVSALASERSNGDEGSRLGELGENRFSFRFGDELLAGKGDRTDNNQNGEDERQKFERRSLHGG